MYSGGKIWNYDGHVNNGKPYTEPTQKQGSSDLCTLTTLNQRTSHVFIYALED